MSLSAPNSLKLEAVFASRKMLAIESSGIVERKSIMKPPFRYFIAMVFWSVTMSPLSPIIAVRKTTIMSMRKRKSITELIMLLSYELVNSGSKASSIGRVMAFHVAITMTK